MSSTLFGEGFGWGPDRFAEGDEGRFAWPSLSRFSGLSANRSEIRIEDVADGASNTYLVGEKYLNLDDYDTGRDWGDNHNVFSGDDMEIVRFTGVAVPALQDRGGLIQHFSFGSAHATGWHVALCDGSVRSVSYDLAPETHRRLGNREDGQQVSWSSGP